MPLLVTTEPPKLQFDAATHTYTLSGRVLPSVTQVLGEAGFSDWLSKVPPDTLFDATERGKAVHTALEFYDQRRLDWASLDEQIVGYVKAYERFHYENDWQVLEIEQPYAHRIYGYAGKRDRLGILNGKKCVLDFKSGELRPEVRLQLAAYARLGGVSGPIERVALKLSKDGRYRVGGPITVGTLEADWQSFLACLNVANWKRAARRI